MRSPRGQERLERTVNTETGQQQHGQSYQERAVRRDLEFCNLFGLERGRESMTSKR